ncbi:MAG: hypothetical protein V1866_06170 [archaeon]
MKAATEEKGEIGEAGYGLVKKSYNESLFKLSKLEENIHFAAYSLVIFAVPFLLGHPQLLVGIIVNAALILGATYVKGHKMLPLIMLPSIAVLIRGMIFGPFTVFLLYMMPFIWLGNAIYAYAFRYLQFRKLNSILSVGIAATMKAALLFGAAFVLVKMSILPTIFLTAMGVLQLATALLGGLLAIGVIKARERIVSD